MQKVHYKLGDKWTFLVGRGLTFNNLYFDAIDSILSPEEDQAKCLKNGTYSCCRVNYITRTLQPANICIPKEKP